MKQRAALSNCVFAATSLYITCCSYQRVEALSEPRPASIIQRRHLLTTTAPATLLLAPILLHPYPVQAARGAAELDLEYYARDLFGGNKKEGNVDASRGPRLPPPRTLKEPLLSLLLSEDASCIPKQVLIDFQRQSLIERGNKDSIERAIQERSSDYRSKVARSFYSRTPWTAEATLSDQYYFDLTAYALWRTAGELLPNPVDRDAYVRQVGRRLYQSMIDRKLLDSPPPTTSSSSRQAAISGATTRLLEVLEVFQTYGFIKSFRLGGDTANDPEAPLFDELDDQALANGSSVDCLFSIFEPATLGAALQITGEQSRFAPDFVGPTVAALWESMNLQCIWEAYFVDNEYRPNPKDYFPNEQLFQFTIASASSEK
jgi:hypothetical protein